MPAPLHPLSRRRLLLAATGALALTACGGGGSSTPPADGPTGGTPGPAPAPAPAPVPAPAPGPQVLGFVVSASAVFVGDGVDLRADFIGDHGRIDPWLGAVASGEVVASGPLDRDQRFRLVVGAAGAQDVERELAVSVDFRNRYTRLPTRFAAAGHAAIAADDGSVLLIGGSRGGAALASSIDRFDPRRRSLEPAGRLLVARTAPVATRLTDGQVLVTGGSLEPVGADLAELVDERTATAVPAGRLNVPRSDHAAVPLGGGRVLVAGGVTVGEDSGIGISASAEIWEPATRTFRRLAARMHTPRAHHTMTRLGNGRILVVGGYTTSPDPVLGEIFDPATERFTPVHGALPLRARHAALPAPDGGVLVLGGEILDTAAQAPVATASVLQFDPAAGLFHELPALTAARTLVQAVMLPGGQALLFGGQTAPGVPTRSAERYDPATGGRTIAALDTERELHSVVRLASGRVAVIGGETTDGRWADNVLIYD